MNRIFRIIRILLIIVFLWQPYAFTQKPYTQNAICMHQSFALRKTALVEQANAALSFPDDPFTQIVRAIFGKKYTITGEYKTGTNARTYIATERANSRKVAIKLADIPGPTYKLEYSLNMARERKKRNFNKYQQLQDEFPAMVKLYDYGFIPAEDFLTNAPAGCPEVLLGKIRALQDQGIPVSYQIMEPAAGEKVSALYKKEFFQDKDPTVLIDAFIDLVSCISVMHEKELSYGELAVFPSLFPMFHDSNILLYLRDEQDENSIAFKALDLDTISDTGVHYEEDCRQLTKVSYLVLLQAAEGSYHEDTIRNVFVSYGVDYVIRNGLGGLLWILEGLKGQISGAGKMLADTYRARLTDI